MKYRAFISYSHKDDRWSRRVHRFLENYKVPKPLVGSNGRDGPIPDRLGVVFRDREELPTSADLGSAIVDALDDSHYLIVICSPRSAESRWVNEEILHFKRSGREDRILSFIIDGEPNASDNGNPGKECFPISMRFGIDEEGKLGSQRIEPIAADARGVGDGSKDALLKLVAGLLGTNFDSLKQREQTRKRKLAVRRAIVFGSLAIISLSLITIASVQSKRANTSAKAEAEQKETAHKLKEQWAGVGEEVPALIDAVLLNDVVAIASLSPSEAELNELYGADSLTPLMIACRIGHADMVGWLLINGAQYDLYSAEGYAAIHYATQEGQPGVIETIAQLGFDLDLPSQKNGEEGWRPIDLAAVENKVNFVKALVENGVSIEATIANISQFNYVPPSAVFPAAMANSEDVMEYLHSQGARLDLVFNGTAPFGLAMMNGSVGVARLIAMNTGMDIDYAMGELLYGTISSVWAHIASLDDFKGLVTDGANPNYLKITDHGSIDTPLLEAAEYAYRDQGHDQRELSMQMLDFLIEAGAEPMVGLPQQWDELRAWLDSDTDLKKLDEIASPLLNVSDTTHVLQLLDDWEDLRDDLVEANDVELLEKLFGE